MQVLPVHFEALVCQSAQFGLLNRLSYQWYPVQLSDVLRLLFLATFGGAYMDSDVVSLGAMPNDLKNFVVEGTSHE